MYSDAVDFGRSVMKFIVTPSQGRDGGGNGMLIPWWACRGALIQWETSQLLTNFLMCASIEGQKKSLETSSAVLRAPK